MRKGILLLSIIFFATSCLDEIDLEVDKGFSETLAIDGKIVKGDPSWVNVRISRLFDFTPDSRRTIVVLGILVRDENANEIPLELTAQEQYAAVIPNDHPSFSVEYFQKYQIEVRTADGRTFASDFAELLPVPEISKVEAVPVSKLVESQALDVRTEEFVEFRIDSPIKTFDNPNNVSLRWEFERTFAVTDNPPPSLPNFRKVCYLTQTAGLFNPISLDGEMITAPQIANYEIYEENVDSRFAQGYVLHIYQESLTNEALTYWQQVQSTVLRNGDMFEAPAGTIVSNIRNINLPNDAVIGFFYATEIDTFRTYVGPEELDFPDTLCIPLPAPIMEPHICLDCLVEPGSSLVKPAYWPN